MLVVSDSTPFIGLIKIGQIDVLPQLYGVVIIPTEVAAELTSPKRPQEVRSFMMSPPSWLSDLKATFENLLKTNFRVNPKTLDGLLEQHQEFKKRQAQ